MCSAEHTVRNRGNALSRNALERFNVEDRPNPMKPRKLRCGKVACVVFLTFAASCKESTPPPTPIGVTFVNFLIVPTTITAGGTNYGTVAEGDDLSVVLPAGTTSVTWTPAKLRYSDGTLVPDDLSSASALVTDGATVDLTNVIGGSTFVAPRITNTTGQTLLFAVYNNSSVSCVGSWGSGGAVQWPYYRVTSSTEFRVYRTGSNCTGAFRFWSNTTILANTESKSGRATLAVSQAP